MKVPVRFFVRDNRSWATEPVTVGVPLPRGTVDDPALVVVRSANGRDLLTQCEILDRWPDGSLRWCLVDFVASANEQYFIEKRTEKPSHVPEPTIVPIGSNYELTTETGKFCFGPMWPFPIWESGAQITLKDRAAETIRVDSCMLLRL
ncbi:MAG: hypothetical protein ACRCZF_08020, partial [Gemmataceae bacterium]